MKGTKKTLSTVATAAVLMFSVGSGTPALAAPSKQSWYYQIGGAQPISRAANKHVMTIPFGFGVGFKGPQSCSGKLDFAAELKAEFDNFGEIADDAELLILTAAQAAVASLPGLILQRANPGLYESIQNFRKQFTDRIQIATKSCEEILAQAAAGKDPFEDWITISTANDWKWEIGTSGIVETKEKIEKNKGRNGVPWIGGKAGGAGQPPIQVIGDVAQAGYDALVSVGGTPYLREIFPTAADLRAMATEVLGEFNITTCDTCGAPSTQVAHGLLPLQTRLNDNVRGEMATALTTVEAGGLLNQTEVNALSAPGIDVDPEILERLNRLEPATRDLVAGRLASEVATARTIEQALLLRRALLAGRRVPEVSANAAALREIDRALAELDGELSNLKFEAEMRQMMVSRTAQLVMGMDETQRGELAIPTQNRPPKALEGGAVRP
ncbi:MAG: integrating conjugative element protein [Gammaproteobacteria bacterium]|nr:integrating conjugative element protein [Gammaproteobacteria bacterium]